jgi:putative tricarboxylic transport membrane protein
LQELQHLFNGFIDLFLDPEAFLWCFIGVTIGTLVGTLPGLGPSAGMAVLLPLTFSLSPLQALLLLMGIYQGVMYGGRISSILINVPGEAMAVATSFDGYPMAKKGKAGYALALSAIASFIGGTIGFIGLVLLTPHVSDWALVFGPPEYTVLMIFALIATGTLGGNSLIKSLITIVFGLLLSTVGSDPVHGSERLTFGFINLWDGISFVVVAIGLFGMSEVLMMIKTRLDQTEGFNERLPFNELFPKIKQIMNNMGSILRGSVIGFVIGILPGAGATIATFLSYSVEKRVSKKPEKFGTGVDQGLSAPEAANNASIGGELIPLFSLGIPGSGITAILLGALIMIGLQPGPSMLDKSGDIIWASIAGLIVANVMLLILNTAFVPMFTLVIKKVQPYLISFVTVLCIIGVYFYNNRFFDVGLMILFGILGYFMRQYGFPLASLILGIVLGSMIEMNLRQTLLITENDVTVFFTRPLSLLFVLLSVGFLVFPLIKKKIKRRKEINAINS